MGNRWRAEKKTLVDVMEKVCTVANKTTGKRMTNKKYHYIYGIKVAFERLTTSKRTGIVGTILQKGYQGLESRSILSPKVQSLRRCQSTQKYTAMPPARFFYAGFFWGQCGYFSKS